MATAKKPSAVIQVPDFKLVKIRVHIIGTAPLMVHAFSEKQRKIMLEKQMKIAQGGREPRDPVAEFEASRYRLPDGRDGIQAIALKDAAVTACTSMSDVTKVAARQAFRVEGLVMNKEGLLPNSFVRVALIPITAGEPRMREDVVRLSGQGRGSEVRYRPEFYPWGAEFNVIVNSQVLSQSHLFAMFRAAGHGVGIGDYRPEKDGDCGTFEVIGDPKEFAHWKKENAL